MGHLRYLTAGESHGPALTVIVEGLPSGLEISEKDMATELVRRRTGFGAGARMKLEADRFEILGGVRHGLTLGSPVSVVIHNSEWESKWSQRMSPRPVDDPPAPLTKPRPGHADWAGAIKYGHTDIRNVLERASARETTARTVAGYLAKVLLGELKIEILSHVVSIGSVRSSAATPSLRDSGFIEESPVRCADAEASQLMVDAIEKAKSDGDTLGGVFEILAFGLPVGLGSHVHWDRKIDARLAAALVSIQAIKGLWFGDQVAGLRGSEAHDEIFWADGYYRNTDRAGGIEGGMTTGQTLRLSVAMKPIATLRNALRTVNMTTHEPARALVERSDVCPVPRACVVGEAVTALVLADAVLEKFGGDSVTELKTRFQAWTKPE